MTLHLQREPSAKGATLGKLSIDGVVYCDTLEDQIREIPGVPVSQWKVQDQTAIPAGRYKVEIAMSPHFKRELPHLLNVPGFSGVLIHGGNEHGDTKGCVLVGRQRWPPDRISDCAPARDHIIDAIKKAGECWITIENPQA
jgi:hypothetical protein